MRIISLSILVLLIFPLFVFAHCPLCTAGAGVGALIAKQLGMKSLVIGVWLGAFAVALGWWLGNVFMKRAARFIPPSPQPSEGIHPLLRRNEPRWHPLLLVLAILISFLSIILPLKLYFYETASFSIFWFGDYGTLFNRTYAYDKFLFGSILGGLIILISPLISKKIIQLREGKIFPAQSLIITFILLIIITICLQIKF